MKSLEELDRSFASKYSATVPCSYGQDRKTNNRPEVAGTDRAMHRPGRVGREPDAYASAPSIRNKPTEPESVRDAEPRMQHRTERSAEIPNALYRFQQAEEAAAKTVHANPARQTAGTLWNILIFTFCILLVVSSAIFAFSSDPQKSFLGYRLHNVLTGSMTPGADSQPGGFSAGDMIVVKRCEPASIAVGDIITFTTDPAGGAYLTHRVREIKTELDGTPGLWFITRGDANNADDPPIPADMAIGKKVFSIPKLGAFLQRTRENLLPSAVFIIALFGFIIALHYCFAKPKGKTMSSQRTRSVPL
jgi:signal peptidase I